ncbi:glycosyltransferase [Chryseobacterium sp. SNU WT5]|uniref:glycosyltransferase family 2 protein n=1 Tax=Chryseobacterium sp. SNU WT5 TaxID=2594269 RepID=UPI00117CF224|nr:glycosyltransferase [Chryseobacterium sp. SNU WT5]QDP85538.1 glycosyltransferase [Chryseobacterium sp. SNU WT5]
MLKITVIIPVYNASAFLKKAVESALQFEEVNEILLIEDCSTDDSLQISKKLAAENSKVQLFQHSDKGNHGAGASRNLGLEKASQDFIAFLDADDYYLPNRFNAERKLFKNEKIEGVFGAIGTDFLSEKGKKEFEEKFKNTTLTTVNYPAEGKEVFDGLLGLTPKVFGTFFHLNALTIRRSAILKNKLRFNENLRVHQDSDFIIKLSYQSYLRSGTIDKAVAIRGVHDNNRITKIVRYSEKYNQRQLLLWRSIYEWADLNNLDRPAKNRIFLIYRSFDLAVKKGIDKYFNILCTVIKDPKILQSRYRFTFLNR